MDPKKTIQTKVVTVTQTLVDGKVVSEKQDVKATEKEVWFIKASEKVLWIVEASEQVVNS